MKKFIIITHKEEECNAINPLFAAPISVIVNQQNKIVIIKVTAIVQAANIPDFNSHIGLCDEAIVLYHLVDNQVSNINLPKVNISSRGHAVVQGSDRWYYEKLLNEKFDAFDEVWNYFEKKSSAEALERLKTDFLYAIYNGKKINIDNLPAFVTPFKDDLEKSINWLANNKYDIEFDKQENEGKDQREHLSLLRNTLLNL